MIYSNLMLVVFLLFLGFDMLHSCNAGAQNPSESFGNTVQKITTIVHLNAHGRKFDISNLVGQSTIDWGSKIFLRIVQEDQGPQDTVYQHGLLRFQGSVSPSDWIRGTA